jgi:ABC-2 type transport system permease protein
VSAETHHGDPAHRLRWTPTVAVYREQLRDRRRSLLWWSVALVGLALMIVAFWPSIDGNTSYDDAMADLPDSVKNLMGVGGDLSLASPAGYLNSQWFATMLPILLLIFGIGAGAAVIAGAEADGSLEDLLDGPVTRREVALGRLKAIGTLLVGLAVVGFVAISVPAPFLDLYDGLGWVDIVAANVAILVLALMHTSLAFAVGAATGSKPVALGAASAVAVVGYLFYGIGSAVDSLSFLATISPWDWAIGSPPILEGFDALMLVPGLLLTALLPLVGIWRFERRDLH